MIFYKFYFFHNNSRANSEKIIKHIKKRIIIKKYKKNEFIKLQKKLHSFDTNRYWIYFWTNFALYKLF